MFIYGKTSANAIAVMSYLAELDPARRAGSHEIAKVRGISQMLTAKLLTRLASAGLVDGIPGPNGGYRLAKSPKSIDLLTIASLFEQMQPPPLCPFGATWCGHRDPCPLHDALMAVMDRNNKFLTSTSLNVFVKKSSSSVKNALKKRALKGLA